MQFVPGGPDIPDQLIQDHADGKVVFFCGAGISIPLGLPNFEQLVDGMVCHVGEPLNEDENEDKRLKRYDSVIRQYESRLVGGRHAFRRHLGKLLTARQPSRSLLRTHRALLDLSRTNDGRTRLISTNQDRIFEEVANFYPTVGPHIITATPQSQGWDGLVYLHGRLPPGLEPDLLDQLILSEKDFGRAYLLEGGHARFVANVLRDQIICFVGYSVDDPILSYMTVGSEIDGFGEKYLFKSAKNPSPSPEYSTRHGCTLIEYRADREHSLLHESLRRWSVFHRRQFQAKSRFVRIMAGLKPDPKAPESWNSHLMMWCLADRSGVPAHAFANHNPLPTLNWLKEFEKPRFSKAHLELLSLVSSKNDGGSLSPVAANFANWLVRHIHDDQLLLWVAKQDGKIHQQFARLIERELPEPQNIVSSGDASTPSQLTQQQRKLWALIIAGRVVSAARSNCNEQMDLWKRMLKKEGLTAALRAQFRDFLSPRITLSMDAGIDLFTRRLNGEHVADRIALGFAFHFADARNVLLQNLNSPGDTLRKHLPSLREDLERLLGEAIDLLNFASEQEVNLPTLLDTSDYSLSGDLRALRCLVRDSQGELNKASTGYAEAVDHLGTQVPKEISDLKEWLKDATDRDLSFEWPDAIDRWLQASELPSWSSELTNFFIELGEPEFSRLINAASQWANVASRPTVPGAFGDVLPLIKRVLRHQIAQPMASDKKYRACVAEAKDGVVRLLVREIRSRDLPLSSGIPGDVEPLLHKAAIGEYGREAQAVLFEHMRDLSRIEGGWVEKMLSPAFRWASDGSLAALAWSKILTTEELDVLLLESKLLRAQFAVAASHHEELGKHGAPRYARQLARVMLDRPYLLSHGKLRSCLRAISKEQRLVVAREMLGAMWSEESPDGHGADKWKEIISSLIHVCWPKTEVHHSTEIAEVFAQIAIRAGAMFPGAVDALFHLMHAPMSLYLVIHNLREANHCREFPEVSLRFLDQVVGEQPLDILIEWDVLETICKAEPSLRMDHRMKRLREYARSGS
ncbi:MAG TPA: SIR2 family protein [Planctomycetota bacterium]|nr:SIR2 family protein [Planctomycetota bacterium]